jgi:hypothetical protein
LLCPVGPSELLDDVVGVAHGVVVAGDTGGVSEDGASPVDANGVGGPAASAESRKAGGGEPESNAMATRSAAMAKTDAAPIPFCRRLTFIEI